MKPRLRRVWHLDRWQWGVYVAGMFVGLPPGWYCVGIGTSPARAWSDARTILVRIRQ